MLVAVLVAVIVLLLLIIWSLRRHRDPALQLASEQPLEELIPSLAGLSQGALIPGNSVEIFENGRFFDALVEEMRTATLSIHIENYIWKDGALSCRLASTLSERARAGVVVRVLVDAIGSNGMSTQCERELTRSGCRVCRFRHGRLRQLALQNERDHRKLCIIDGKTVFLGGHCIEDLWLGDGEDPKHYRDVSVRIRGPAVQAAQSTFGENWLNEVKEAFVGDAAFPPVPAAGNTTLHFARTKRRGAPSATRLLYHLVIGMARKRLYFQNSYFVPSERAIRALAAAVERGVDVRIMVPAADVSDFPVVQHAAHRNFEQLLAAGVRLFEYRRTLLHQKLITADGVWCAIGSSNFDERSLDINDEVTVGFFDAGLANRLEEIFHRDGRECVELELGTWRDRGWWHRGKDYAAHILSYQL